MTAHPGRTLVVDASTIVAVLIDPLATSKATALLEGAVLHGPDHLLVEVTNVLRRRRNNGLLSRGLAEEAFAVASTIPVQLWPFAVVATRVWQLGANLSSYDAAYVALAEQLGVPFVTRDARIARAPGTKCRIDVW